jgi:RNA polymerase sigma-70 factor (ECF subfamily)
LTTVTARVCLDMLRARKSRHEEPFDAHTPEPVADRKDEPEHEALMADSVGLALLVVLATLTPAERVAFVLHDMFDLPFDDIAPIVGRSSTATRQLASRARRRVQGKTAVSDIDLARQREVVEAFLAASHRGDFDALLAVLDPEIVFHADATAVRMGASPEIRGAAAVARTFKGRAQAAQPRLIDGAVGLAVILRGELRVALSLTFAEEKIVAIEAIADANRLGTLDILPLETDWPPRPAQNGAS